MSAAAYSRATNESATVVSDLQNQRKLEEMSDSFKDLKLVVIANWSSGGYCNNPSITATSVLLQLTLALMILEVRECQAFANCG